MHGALGSGYDTGVPDAPEREEYDVGLDDKAKNQATDAKGKAKEAAGAVTGDESLKAEGRDDQGQAKAKEAGRHVKEAASDVKESLKP